MPHFQSSEETTRTESGTADDVRVVKITQNVEPTVENFKFPDIKQAHGIQPVRSFAPSASPQGVVLVAPNDTSHRENRFILSQLAKKAFSITKEEEALMESRVQERVDALAQRTREDAFKQGYADGVKDGHEAAFKKATLETTRRMNQIDTLLGSMEKAKLDLFAANQEFLMNVIYRISKVVLLREITTDKDYLIRLSKELIERCGLRDNLIVKIHPTDAQAMDELKAGLVQSFGSLSNLTIELTDEVQRGGCILETEWGAIDGSIDTQLSQIMGSLDVPQGTVV